ncbi:MAG: hypothetical protein GYB31_01780 [Bacteroidetes bacterium]|nr:hypothetical protein [Bacteroidota bacterium]
MKFVLVFWVLIGVSTTISAQQSKTCLSCVGSGSVYVEREVVKSTTTTFESYGSLPHMVRSSTTEQYGTEGGYESCARCGGTGRIHYTAPATPTTAPKRVLTLRESIMKEYLYKMKPEYELLDVPGGRFHEVSYRSDGKYERDILFSSGGNSFRVFYQERRNSSFDVLKDGAGNFVAVKVFEDGTSKLYDAKGQLKLSLRGHIQAASTSAIWVEDLQRSAGKAFNEKYYRLVSYPGQKQLLSKSVQIQLPYYWGDLLDKKQLAVEIDIDEKDGSWTETIIDMSGKEAVSLPDLDLVYVDGTDPYIYFVDRNTNELLMYDFAGNPFSTRQILKKDCGQGVECQEISYQKWPDDIYASPQEKYEKMRTKKIVSVTDPAYPYLHGYEFDYFGRFDKTGWASVSPRSDDDLYLAHTSGLIAKEKSGRRMRDYYNHSRELDIEANIDWISPYHFELVRKGDKVGAKVVRNFEEGNFELKPAYRDVRLFSNNIIAVQDYKSGKWGAFMVYEGRYGKHKIKPQYDEVYSVYRENYVFGRKGDEWYKTFFEGKRLKTVEITDDLKSDERRSKELKLAIESGLRDYLLIDYILDEHPSIKPDLFGETKMVDGRQHTYLKDGRVIVRTTQTIHYQYSLLDRTYKDYLPSKVGCLAVKDDDGKWRLLRESGDGESMKPYGGPAYAFDEAKYIESKRKGHITNELCLINKQGAFILIEHLDDPILEPIWLNEK